MLLKQEKEAVDLPGEVKKKKPPVFPSLSLVRFTALCSKLRRMRPR